jgi:hypothetical protein
MKIERCEKCGQIIPPVNPFLPHKPIAALIYDCISAHPEGVTRAQVADFVYKDHQDGGPDYALEGISVRIGIMNKILAKMGLRITSSMGHGAIYRLEEWPVEGIPVWDRSKRK